MCSWPTMRCAGRLLLHKGMADLWLFWILPARSQLNPHTSKNVLHSQEAEIAKCLQVVCLWMASRATYSSAIIPLVVIFLHWGCRDWIDFLNCPVLSW